MKKRFLVFFVAVAFIAPVILFAGAPGGTIKIKKTGSKKPAVSFSHKKHAGNKDCKSCHKAAKSKKTAHKLCRGCHKAKGGPTKCKACHK